MADSDSDEPPAKISRTRFNWDEEKEAKFHRLFKRYDTLWRKDEKIPLSHRQTILKYIGRQIGEDVAEVERKIHSVRVYFATAKRNHIKHGYVNLYPGEQRMIDLYGFLWEHTATESVLNASVENIVPQLPLNQADTPQPGTDTEPDTEPDPDPGNGDEPEPEPGNGDGPEPEPDPIVDDRPNWEKEGYKMVEEEHSPLELTDFTDKDGKSFDWDHHTVAIKFAADAFMYVWPEDPTRLNRATAEFISSKSETKLRQCMYVMTWNFHTRKMFGHLHMKLRQNVKCLHGQRVYWFKNGKTFQFRIRKHVEVTTPQDAAVKYFYTYLAEQKYDNTLVPMRTVNFSHRYDWKQTVVNNPPYKQITKIRSVAGYQSVSAKPPETYIDKIQKQINKRPSTTAYVEVQDSIVLATVNCFQVSKEYFFDASCNHWRFKSQQNHPCRCCVLKNKKNTLVAAKNRLTQKREGVYLHWRRVLLLKKYDRILSQADFYCTQMK